MSNNFTFCTPIKALKYIIWGLLAVIGVFYILPVGLLKVPAIQKKISSIASEKFQERLGVDVQIGRVDFELFNKLILKDVYLEDQAGDTLLYAKRLAAGFDFKPLLKGKLIFSSAQLFSFQVNLSKETIKSPLNLQFVIDAFAKKDTVKKETNIDLRIRNLNLRRGSFSYHVKDSDETPGKFNPKHVNIKDISAKIHINHLTNKLLHATVARLAFSEHSGLNVRRLALDLQAGTHQASIKKLELQLDNSLLQIEDIKADYQKLSDSHEYIRETIIDLTIVPSTITLKDISPIVPVISNFTDKMSIQGHLSGSMNDFKLDNFQLTDGNQLMLQANVQLKNATDSENIYIDGSVDESFISPQEIKKLINNLSKKETELPPQIYHLGNVRFEGKLSGYLNDLTAYGILNTDIGSIRTDVKVGREKDLFIKGNVSSNGVNLKKLFDDNPKLGNASFNIDIDAIQSENKELSGSVTANIGRFDFNNYSYNNIKASGIFTNKSFNGSVDIDSPEGKLTSEGFYQLTGETSIFNFSAKADNVKLDKLNLSNKYKESELSFCIDANFTGNNIDNMIGDINLTGLKFNTEKGGYYLDTLEVHASQENAEKVVQIRSDIIHGEMRGIYSFKTIVPSIKQTISQYLPTILPASNNKNFVGVDNHFSLDLTIEDMEELSYIFDLPFTLYNKTKIIGQYNSSYNKFRFEAYIPKFDAKKIQFESGKLSIDNSGKEISLKVDAVSLRKNNKKFLLSSQVSAVNDSLNTTLNWEEPNRTAFKGTIAFATKFMKQTTASPITTQIDILESAMVFNDSIWRLHPAYLLLDSGKIKISNLVIEHDQQYLKMDGIISSDLSDSLIVDLNKVDLKYIFNTLAIKALDFGGIASGFIQVKDPYKTRQLNTRLNVTDLTFNNVGFGNLDLAGSWDDKEQGISMIGTAIKNDTSFVDVNGIIYPVKGELSIDFKALNGDAAMLRKYMDNIAKDVSGIATGDIRLFGTFKKPTIEGNVFIKDGAFSVDFLNTRYNFSDSVYLLPDRISIKNARLLDKFGKTAIVNGSVSHNRFSDFNFSVNIDADNFLVYDASPRQNPSFYGTAFGTGTAKIYGTEKSVNFDVSIRSNRNTKIGLNFMEEADISDYDFINFAPVKKKEDSIKSEDILPFLINKPVLLQTNTKTEIKFNLLLNATPDATIEVIMDPVAGDKIKGYGNGNLQIQYGTKTPLKIFGNYSIDKGNYNFSLQQVIFKDFSIREGSTVAFKGDPYSANLDIDAIYTLSANLGDLDASLIEETPRTNVLVNCVLGISGDMAHPGIKFDLELPGSNPELERRVKSIINTDDMMNRQMVYLLILNKFYTIQDNLGSNTSQTNDFASVASATLSSQLSSLLGSISENVQIGTRIKTKDKEFTDTEVALLLSSQLLDNKLIFNGNFGYRDNPNIGEKSKFVGDFDLEYKLNRTGDIRLKAYNHYNNNYYNIKTANTTQGVGIVFKKDFDKLSDILIPKKKLPVVPLIPEPPKAKK